MPIPQRKQSYIVSYSWISALQTYFLHKILPIFCLEIKSSKFSLNKNTYNVFLFIRSKNNE